MYVAGLTQNLWNCRIHLSLQARTMAPTLVRLNYLSNVCVYIYMIYLYIQFFYSDLRLVASGMLAAVENDGIPHATSLASTS